jgi:hypothetical protein
MLMLRFLVSALIGILGLCAPHAARALDLGGQNALVIASRASEGDVIAFLNDQALALNDLAPASATRIFLAENGWYAIAIGLFASADCENRLSRLVRTNAIPSDSYCSSGARYLAEFARSGTRLVLTAGAMPQSEASVVTTPKAPAPATTLRDIITGTRWSVFDGPCTARSENYQEFLPSGYSVTIRGEPASGQIRVTVFDVDEATGRFVMEYETYSDLQSAPWSIVLVEGQLLPDGRLDTREVIRTTTIETMGALRPRYDSVVETATLSPCIGDASPVQDYAVPEITILPTDIGTFADVADCQDTFDDVRQARTDALFLTGFYRDGEQWRWEFIPTESCLSDQTNVDLGLCGIDVEADVRVTLDKPGMVVVYAGGTCTFESRFGGVRGIVDVVTTARGQTGSGLPCMDGAERAQALVCLDGP